jgi:hypothetical protein
MEVFYFLFFFPLHRFCFFGGDDAGALLSDHLFVLVISGLSVLSSSSMVRSTS